MLRCIKLRKLSTAHAALRRQHFVSPNRKDLDMTFIKLGNKRLGLLMLPVAMALAISSINVQAAEVDADAANALAKKNDCFKCHAVDKTKKGPSYKKIAAKYKGKADGEEKAIKNMTSGLKVKLEDGTEEEHKVIDTKDPKELKNLAQWILSR
jgi:cytochrome c